MSRHLWRIVGVVAFGLALSACHQNGTVFAVDTSADTVDVNPGDGLCADTSGDCSLRAAVMEANALPGVEEIALSDDAVYRPSDGIVITEGVVITGDATIDTAVPFWMFTVAASGLVEFDGPDFVGSSTAVRVEDGSVVTVRHADLDRAGIEVLDGSLSVFSSSAIDAPIVAHAGHLRLENVSATTRNHGWLGDLVVVDDAVATIVSSSVTNGQLDVSAGGTGSILVQSSILDVDCTHVVSLGHNLMTGRGCTPEADGDIAGADYPLSSGLRDNGGAVLTLLPERFGDAIDRGLTAGCALEATDARGVTRPFGTACDIGAVELEYGADCASPGPGADLRLCDLRAADLAGADLTGADLTEANLEQADLTGAVLAGTTFSRALLDGARFVDADLTDADLSFANGSIHADGADFTRAALEGVSVHSADGADFTDAYARGFSTYYLKGSMVGAHVEGADFTDANFYGVVSGGVTGDATFTDGKGVLGGYIIDSFVRIDGVDLTGLDTGDLNFGRVSLVNSDLTGLRINASWAGTYSGSTLDETDWTGIYAANSRFDGASIVGATMVGTDFESSYFGDAVVVGTDFTDASLWGSRFTDAVVLLNRFDNTTCPSGVNSDDNGGNCDGQWVGAGPLDAAPMPTELQGMTVEDFFSDEPGE